MTISGGGTAAVSGGPRVWGGKRSKEGHREYTVTHLVKASNVEVGPATVLTASGLPAIGSVWSFPGESDNWAFCTPERTVSLHEHKEGEPHVWWRVDDIFTTARDRKRCQDESIDDPLMEPAEVSGSFVKYTREATHDKDGNAITTPSKQQIRGPQVEFDEGRPTVRISKNYSTLGLDTFSAMLDTVNDTTLWGLPARCIKLSNISWSRKVYGVCDYYYTRAYEFDINYNTFDRTILREDTKVLNGHWEGGAWVLDNIDGNPPDPDKQSHFITYKDKMGDPSTAIVNADGTPWLGTYSYAGGLPYITIQKYTESNFLLLGIPTSF